MFQINSPDRLPGFLLNRDVIITLFYKVLPVSFHKIFIVSIFRNSLSDEKRPQIVETYDSRFSHEWIVAWALRYERWTLLILGENWNLIFVHIKQSDQSVLVRGFDLERIKKFVLPPLKICPYIGGDYCFPGEAIFTFTVHPVQRDLIKCDCLFIEIDPVANSLFWWWFHSTLL